MSRSPSAGGPLRARTRRRALRYLTSFSGLVLAALGLTHTGWWCWAFPLEAFALIPLLELLLPPDASGLSEEETAAALHEPLYDVLVYLVVPVQWLLLVVFLRGIDDPGLSTLDVAGRTFTMGLLCGVYGINVAHELGHRRNRWERDLARALLLTSLYLHFIIEHNRGHHRRVATPDDPASARFGEPIYLFWPRTVVGSFLSAWHIEAERLRQAGHAPYGLRNEMLRAMALQGLLVAGIGWGFGGFVLQQFLIAAGVGILLLETVNYIEHYGLRRTRTGRGTYCRVMPVHSWNSDHLLGRLMLFELTRHSDHHYKASKKYQVLESMPDSPQLPTGYPGMMVLSLLPPLFFAVMHPRLRRLSAGQPGLELAA